jgi:hypothetical protein
MGPRIDLDDVERRKFFPLPGFELRPRGHPGYSQSLYRLSYTGSPREVCYLTGPSPSLFVPTEFKLLLNGGLWLPLWVKEKC